MPRDGVSKYVDKRNWPEYNERLVKRGELYLTLDFLDNWDHSVKQLNEGKRGRPYEFPWEFIEFLGYIHLLLMPYRQIEGFLRKLSEFIPEIKVADYTTIWWRISRLELPSLSPVLESSDEPIVVAVDSSGVKVTNRGEWLRKKWNDKEYKGWIKIHIAIDVETGETVGIEVSEEYVTDESVIPSLIHQVESRGRKIERMLGDGAYYTNSVYNILEEKDIDAGIRIRKDASTRAKGSPYRAKCVREFKRVGYENWRVSRGYGKRWIAEAIFSSEKRIFGEYVKAKRKDLMFKEVKMKFALLNLLANMK